MKPWKLISLAAIVVFASATFVRMATGSPTPPGPCYDQPNMAAALSSLKAARASLDKAEHNKGGWRVAAIEATSKAIAETDRGCAFANR